MKILFQGDSITDAFRKPEEINPAYQLGNGYALLAASSLARRFPRHGLEFWNRGISGNTVADLWERWSRDTLDIDADVVSLLIGVNDTIRAMNSHEASDDAAFIETYALLLDSVRNRNLRARIIVMEPFLLEAGGITPRWKEHLKPRQEAIGKLAAEKGVPLIPLQSRFDQACLQAPAAFWSYDGIHPTHAGFQLIADAWLEVFAKISGL